MGAGIVAIQVADYGDVPRSVLFWSSDGTTSGNLVALQTLPEFAPTPPNAFPATIVPGTPYSSGIITAPAYQVIAVAATLAAQGSITIQRWMDVAGQIPVGAPLIITLSAGSSGLAAIGDGLPFLAFTVSIANNGSSAAALTGAAILMGSWPIQPSQTSGGGLPRSNIPAIPVTPPASLDPSAIWSSGIIEANGFNGVSLSALLSELGTLTLHRYIDLLGLVEIGEAQTDTMEAGILAYLVVNDGLNFASFSFSVQNIGGEQATLGSVNVLQGL